MALDLTLACYQYAWTEPLWDGRVQPQGVDLTTIDYPNPERFRRMAQRLEFDVCELSMGTYLASRRDPEAFPFTALPVFPYRRFRHAYMYRRRDAGIDDPGDLAGARVGLINWQTTTGIWQRGYLADRYGVDLSNIDWYAGGREIVETGTGNCTVEYLDHPRGSALPLLDERLDRGDLDALLIPIESGAESAARLFPDPLETERAYHRETGIFPIMHTIVVRDSLLEKEPWLAQSLYDAFEAAKQRALESLDRPRWMPLAWVKPLVDEQRAILGDDPWEYGLTSTNRTVLETLVEYAHDQGVAAEPYDLADLFATAHLDETWF